jgi:hypothetical protein
MSENNQEMVIDTIERQRNYVQRERKKGQGLGIVFADAFLRGMRDIGYKNPAWALAEMVDNSFQAGATSTSIRFGFNKDNKTETKPDMVALCDDGNGMIPEMLSFAVRWGGTDREGDRHGFGRYGYGLPSAAVSLACRYTVYSKAPGGDWHAVTIDIAELSALAGDLQATEAKLTPVRAEPPKWVLRGSNEDKLDLTKTKSGTVVILEDLDRLRTMGGWIKASTLESKLLQALGVIYRHWLPGHRLVINGTLTQAVDPLFLMEHARFYDETPIRAQAVDARTFEVEMSNGVKGRVSIRASVMPPNFQWVDPDHLNTQGAKPNKRFDIMKDYNNLLICRERRQIDCIAPKWTAFQNNERNIKIEIDFDPQLDEFFGITTSKQQIEIDDEMWERLGNDGKNGGALVALIKDLKAKAKEMKVELEANIENRLTEEKTRASVLAMQETEKFKDTVPEPTPEQKQEAEKNLDELAGARAKASGLPKEQVKEQVKEETTKHKWFVDFNPIPEGPFYRPMRLGEQKRIIVNTEHPFYTKLYCFASREAQAALEVMLFVLGERELDAKGDAETFYKSERPKWSERLRRGLDKLVTDDALADRLASLAESLAEAEKDKVTA